MGASRLPCKDFSAADIQMSFPIEAAASMRTIRGCRRT